LTEIYFLDRVEISIKFFLFSFVHKIYEMCTALNKFIRFNTFRCRIALESSAGRFRIGGQPEDLFDLMNYTDQEGCQIENCEDSFEDGEFEGGRVARSRDRVEADESIIGDNRPRNKHEMKRTEEKNGRLTRRRRYEKEAMQWHEGKQYRHKEPPHRSDTSEPKFRIKSMRSKITRKDQRRVVPNHYLNGDPERPNETFGGATVRNLFKREKMH